VRIDQVAKGLGQQRQEGQVGCQMRPRQPHFRADPREPTTFSAVNRQRVLNTIMAPTEIYMVHRSQVDTTVRRVEIAIKSLEAGFKSLRNMGVRMLF
jgi:hypothetical protein